MTRSNPKKKKKPGAPPAAAPEGLPGGPAAPKREAPGRTASKESPGDPATPKRAIAGPAAQKRATTAHKASRSTATGPAAPKRAIAGPATPKRIAAAPDFIHTAAFWGLALLLFLAPFFRGLFFQPEQQKALIFAAVIFWLAWLWKSSRKDNSFLSHPLDYFVLALPVVYLISAFHAVNYGLAVDEVIKTVLYFTVFWLASRLVRDDIDIAALLQVIYFSAVCVALVGLATATGIIHIKDGFLGGRIYSTFQYPNALASYLAAVTFIGIYLWRSHAAAPAPHDGPVVSGTTSKAAPAPHETAPATSRSGSPMASKAGVPSPGHGPNITSNPNSLSKKYIPYLYAACNFLLFATLLGTKSNGGLLVFLVVFALFIAGQPGGGRANICTHFTFIAAPSLLAAWQFLAAAEAGRALPAWTWLLTGLVLTLAGQALYDLMEKKGALTWMATHKKAVLAAALLVAAAAVTTAGVYAGSHSDALKTIAEEIRLRNATERMYFFQDALKMFKERPLTGWGGGGWEEAYQAYQSYLYSSRQVHGYYFQVMVEAGIAGLLVVLGIWASFLAMAHKIFYGTKGQPRRFLAWTLTMAALIIGLHAAIDFDLSLSALALVLWTIFGLLRGMGTYTGFAARQERKSPLPGDLPGVPAGKDTPASANATAGSTRRNPAARKGAPKSSLPPGGIAPIAAVTAATIAAIIFTGSLAAAGSHFNKATKAQDLNTAIAALQKAAACSPFNADYHTYLTRCYQNAGAYDAALAAAQKAVDLSQYNPHRRGDLATAGNRAGKRSEAVAGAEKALALAPFHTQWYEFFAATCFTAGFGEITGGHPETAAESFAKAARTPGLIEAQARVLSPVEQKLWKDAPPLAATPPVHLYTGASQYFLGQWEQAGTNLQAALEDENTRGEASFWLAVLREKQGRSQESAQLLEETRRLIPQLAEKYDEYKNLLVKN